MSAIPQLQARLEAVETLPILQDSSRDINNVVLEMKQNLVQVNLKVHNPPAMN